MKIVAPSWFIKGKVCPCCGQGNPEFFSCPSCGHIVLVCLENGTIFPEPRNMNTSMQSANLCIECRAVSFVNFKSATDEQLVKLGYAGEYE
ncbi:hypothetical protein JNO04_15290 [Halomonas sp. MC140]|nr:hypothetical protein [Halomonas sp. MC140]MDN7133709.1 hypothetical protein [Halomonas sp. MC140]